MMQRSVFAVLTVAMGCACGGAFAATVDITATTADGDPAAGAIVSLEPRNGSAPMPANLPVEAMIDQRHQMFVPFQVTIRQGGHVVFANHDATMHQVYSFSPIKQFEYEIRQGEKSPPVVFDKPGVAAIGCNIHDNMVAFVYVAGTPWVATLDAGGHAHITNVPEGNYRASIWHPRLVPGRAPPTADLRVSGNETPLVLSVPLLGGPMPGMKHKHSQDY